MLDLDEMTQLIQQSVAGSVNRAYGEDGVIALIDLFTVVRTVFRTVDPSTKVSLTVLFPLNAKPAVAGYDIEVALAGSKPSLILEVVSRKRVIIINEPIDVANYTDTHLIYEYHNAEEAVLVGGTRCQIRNPVPQCASVFAVPRFRHLEDALDSYANSSIRFTACLIFAAAWANLDTRLVFCNKPEAKMRDSLEQFLRNVISDADVRPEAVVDTTHPVDIRVAWRNSNSVALIEIKWLGASFNADGTGLTKYSAGRALEGATQLADYLVRNAPRGAVQQTRGYLVVVDGRRGGLHFEKDGRVTAARPAAFRHDEIEFDPDYSASRDDFGIPRRMYAEPA